MSNKIEFMRDWKVLKSNYTSVYDNEWKYLVRKEGKLSNVSVDIVFLWFSMFNSCFIFPIEKFNQREIWESLSLNFLSSTKTRLQQIQCSVQGEVIKGQSNNPSYRSLLDHSWIIILFSNCNCFSCHFQWRTNWYKFI